MTNKIWGLKDLFERINHQRRMTNLHFVACRWEPSVIPAALLLLRGLRIVTVKWMMSRQYASKLRMLKTASWISCRKYPVRSPPVERFGAENRKALVDKHDWTWRNYGVERVGSRTNFNGIAGCVGIRVEARSGIVQVEIELCNEETVKGSTSRKRSWLWQYASHGSGSSWVPSSKVGAIL